MMSIGPRGVLVFVYTQMLGLMSKENSNWPEQSRCVEELMNWRLDTNSLVAVIYDNIQIKEYCIIIVNKLMKGSYACVSFMQETTFLKHPVWYHQALRPFCRTQKKLSRN